MNQDPPSQEKTLEPSSIPKRHGIPEFFRKFSEQIARWVGTWQAFVISILMVVVWAVTGPLFNYSDTWQLIINTSTTVITFWLVFVIQYTQNRDNKALHLKIDELVSAVPEAHDELISVEQMSDEELEDLHQRILRKRHGV